MRNILFWLLLLSSYTALGDGKSTPYDVVIQDGFMDPELTSQWPPNVPVSCAIGQERSGPKWATFVCADFAYAYKRWWTANLPSLTKYVWQVKIRGDLKDEKGAGHIMNILEVHPKGSIYHKFCLIEPQGNDQFGCWRQEGAVPKIPGRIFDILAEKHFAKWKRESLYQADETNKDGWGGNSDRQEHVLESNVQSRAMFELFTGIDPDTFKQRKAPADPELIIRFKRSHSVKEQKSIIREITESHAQD